MTSNKKSSIKISKKAMPIADPDDNEPVVKQKTKKNRVESSDDEASGDAISLQSTPAATKMIRSRSSYEVVIILFSMFYHLFNKF